ncbi:MAG: hypothetical protein M3O70_15855, partial [Actinomycetota bacterium]|nr:hypothetical protein [Actinomycetota bacterium]
MRWFDVTVERRQSPRPKKPWWSRALFWGFLLGPWPYLLAVVVSQQSPGRVHLLAAVLLTLVVAFWRFPRLRQSVKGLWRSAWVRRKWMIGSSVCGLITDEGFVPKVLRCKSIPAGDQLLVRLPRGGCVSDLEKAAERMAAMLEVQEIRVTRHPSNARFADVTLVRRDPLAHDTPIPWPYAEWMACSLWEPIPVGIDENGQAVWL